jgi:hypothetical protein
MIRLVLSVSALLFIAGCVHAAGIDTSLEAIAERWFRVGFTCGEVRALNIAGAPAVLCGKWNKRFHNEEK